MSVLLFGAVLHILVYANSIVLNENPQDVTTKNSNMNRRGSRQDSFTLGSCKIILYRLCPHPDVKYFLYTRKHVNEPEEVRLGADPFVSNLSQSAFNSTLPTKIVIHGYNSDMFLNGLLQMKKQYLMKEDMNVFVIDWGALAPAPCYPAAVWNTNFAGKCSALLLERLRELNTVDLHVIGFSLGAHVAGFMANHLAPYKIPRITGLDPAMPGFLTVPPRGKLDRNDAQFVDVIHTNAFFQGQLQESGHVDFYVNGGVVQPGCWVDDRYFACNHHRSLFYFAESINSEPGFWGWPCPNFYSYLLGRCQPHEPQVKMGEDVNVSARGMHLVITDSVPPFAVGKFSGPTIEIIRKKYADMMVHEYERYKKRIGGCSEYVIEDCVPSGESESNFHNGLFETLVF